MYKFKEINAAWEEVKESFRGEISGISIDLWFGSIKLIGYRDHVLYMEMESQALYNIVMTNYFETLRARFKEFLDPDFEIDLKCTGHVVTAADILRQMGYVKKPVGTSKNGENGYELKKIIKGSDNVEYELERIEGVNEEAGDDRDFDGSAKAKDFKSSVDAEAAEKLEDPEKFEKFEEFEEFEELEDAEKSKDRARNSRSRQNTEGDVPHSLHMGYADPFDVEDPTEEDLKRSNFELSYNLNYLRDEESMKAQDPGREAYSDRDAENNGTESQNGDKTGVAINRGGVPNYDFQYTFDNFIVGSSNKFAHAACVAVAEHPALNYNPLFIYGQSGLGKTHLLNAITNHLRKKNPNVKIIYVKGEDFTNYMIDCISRQAMKEFRDTYRKCDVLLIDDIQFIAGKESTQEEFFHTFNALYDERKQIILTSDRPPRDIQHLEARLRSRFEWGLLADIQPPDLELRIAITKSKAESVNLELSPEILQYLSENLRENVRQIEGAIKKLGAINFLSGRPISLEDAARCVSELLEDSEPTTVTIDKIFTVVYRKYNVSKEDLLSSKRNKNIAQARHVAIYLIREIIKMSTPSIGTIFNRDHTTIMSSIEAVTKKISNDQMFAVDIKELKKQVQNFQP